MKKKILKSLTRSHFFQSILAWLVAMYMRLVYKTSQWQIFNRSHFETYGGTNKPGIACFWHNRLGMMAYGRLPGMKFSVLISGHADGRVISKAMAHLGIGTITGSTSKGSSEAIRKLLQTLHKGECVAVTPDGPRGPRFSVNIGLLKIAAKAGVDLIPMTYSTSRRVLVNSWDRFILPLPFSKGVIMYGEPIRLSKNASEQELNKSLQLLQERLIDISNESDHLCGNEIIPPAEIKKGMAI